MKEWSKWKRTASGRVCENMPTCGPHLRPHCSPTRRAAPSWETRAARTRVPPSAAIPSSLTGLEVNNPPELSNQSEPLAPPPVAPPLRWLHLQLREKARSSVRARAPRVVTPSTPQRSTRYLVAFDPEIGRLQEGEQGSQKRGISRFRTPGDRDYSGYRCNSHSGFCGIISSQNLLRPKCVSAVQMRRNRP